MPTACPHCKHHLDFFKENIYCPYCGNPMHVTEESAQRMDYFWWYSIPALLLFPAIARVLKIDWLYIVLITPALIVLILAAHASWSWFKHRKEPGGLSLK
jgi:hypothetical protein